MSTTRHREVGEYLRRLQRLMSDLPDERCAEIVGEVEEHISQRLSEIPDPGDADVRNVLERLGDAEDIAADARERFGLVAPTPAEVADRQASITTFDRVVRASLFVLAGLATLLALAASLGIAEQIALLVIAGLLVWGAAQVGRRHRSGSGKGTNVTIVIVVVALVVVPLAFSVLGSLTVVPTPFEGPRRVITEGQFDRVRLGDTPSVVVDALGGRGERGSLVSGVVDADDIRLEETPPDVPRQHYRSCWIYSVTGSGAGAQAGVCFVGDEIAYKRIEKSR